MAVDFTQDNLYLTVSTPLGRDKLLLTHFHGEERLSGLFHFSLEMLSEDHGLDFKKRTIRPKARIVLHWML
jgi:type VI secretion system secreted protein VgrG